MCLAAPGCGLGKGESGCGTRREFNAECGAINVTRGPQGDGGDTCEWTINVQEGNIINITVAQFHMADTGKTGPYNQTFPRVTMHTKT